MIGRRTWRGRQVDAERRNPRRVRSNFRSETENVVWRRLRPVHPPFTPSGRGLGAVMVVVAPVVPNPKHPRTPATIQHHREDARHLDTETWNLTAQRGLGPAMFLGGAPGLG